MRDLLGALIGDETGRPPVSASARAEEALAAGCDHFVPKPFDLDALLLAVETALVRTGQPAQAPPDRSAARRA